MTIKERKIINDLKRDWSEFKVSRRSEKEYDLSIEGTYKSDHYLGGTKFSAWLPLFYIRERTTWTSPNIAQMTDYPDMVLDGDWSGVRDSSTEKIWEIFHHVI